MREWLVIESAYQTTVFATPELRKPRGYIPRDAAEDLLGRDLGGMVWFTKEQSAKMRGHPEWTEDEPKWSPLGFWNVDRKSWTETA